MPRTEATPARGPIFAPGMGRRMWARIWPVPAFYMVAGQASAFRSIADDIGFPVRRRFTGFEDIVLTSAPTHWLQGSIIDIHATQLASTAVYMTWFLVPITTAVWVLLFQPRDYWRFIAFLALVYCAVMPFFALYPLEAPWAHDPSIHRYMADMFPKAVARDPNPNAAMPSLHVGLTVAAALWYGLRTAPGKFVLAYSALISFVVVYQGDHYVADALGGYAVAAAAYGAARWLRLPVFARESAEDATPRVPTRTEERLRQAA